VDLAIDLPEPVTPSQAAEASKRYPWFHGHPYPTCFVCGPERSEGDGLRIFPGAVDGRPVAAAPWIVDPSLCEGGVARREIVWASLDCPSWYGMFCFHPFEGQILLGRLAARIHSLPRAGQRCVAMGWFIDRDARKIRCGSAVHDESGTLIAAGRATWIVLR
jgi:hypothetical protein